MSSIRVRPFRRSDRDQLTHTGHTEIVYLARVEDLPRLAGPPLAGLSARRSVGTNGCRLSAVLGPDVVGYIEVETFDGTELLSRNAGWADVGNLRVAEPYRRRGVGSWLLGQAADWLRLAHVDLLLDYAWLGGTDPGGHSYDDYRAFLARRRLPRADSHSTRMDPDGSRSGARHSVITGPVGRGGRSTGTMERRAG